MNTKIVESMRKISHQKSKLFKLLDNVDGDSLNSTRKDGSWDVLQVLTHIYEAELGSLMYVKKKCLGIEALENCNWKSNINSVLLQISLYLPTKFKAPKIVSNPNVTMDYFELKGALVKLDEQYLDYLKDFSESNMRKAIYKHPFVGRLTILQMLRFNKAHLFHHKRQIKSILKA